MRDPNYRRLWKRERKKLRRLKKEFQKVDRKYEKLKTQKEDINTIYYLTRDKRFLPQKRKIAWNFKRARARVFRLGAELGDYIMQLRRKRKGSRLRIPDKVTHYRTVIAIVKYRKTHKPKYKPRVKKKKEEIIKPKWVEVGRPSSKAATFKGFAVGFFTCMITEDYDGWLAGDVKSHYCVAHIEEGYVTFGNASKPYDQSRITPHNLRELLLRLHAQMWTRHEVLRMKLSKVVVQK